MTTKERYKIVISWFLKNNPTAETELHYSDPFQLLVAVMLSAQCTDKRVNATTPALFDKFPNATAMAAASEEEVFELIRSVSYPNSKTRHLIQTANLLEQNFGGIVPDTFDELITLPGVGRKTANVVLSVVFDQAKMAVDTHVFRVANRIGLTQDSKTPLATEKELIKYIPKEYISRAHHWLILHGRYICQARRPHCEECGITEACLFYNNKEKNVSESRKKE